jgi:hypothetical protein
MHQKLFLSLLDSTLQLSHYSRPDSDKMLSDMAEGSGYSKGDDPYDEYEDDDDFSGSGDGTTRKSSNNSLPILSSLPFSFYLDLSKTPDIQAGSPTDPPHNTHTTKHSGSSKISLKSSIISLLLIVILFKQL